jgi:F-type H+-transporting ATPase subunit gamma
MATVRDLRDRIKSLKNTQQITKAMKQVAAAKIRRAEIAQRQARPYAETMTAMLQDLIDAAGAIDHPFMRPGKADARKGIIIMTADKGLAGSFNSNIIRAAEQMKPAMQDIPPREERSPGGISETLAAVVTRAPRWYAVGIKARNAVRRMPGEIGPDWVFSSGSKLDTARQIAAKVTDDFVAGEISEIVLVQSKLVSTMVQRPLVRTLIPIVAEDRERPKGPRAVVEFAPSPEDVLKLLLPKFLEFTLFSAMLETEAAFYAAQLVAMTNATDNAGKLIDELTVQMNKARQASITKELLEIVGGAEALVG